MSDCVFVSSQKMHPLLFMTHCFCDHDQKMTVQKLTPQDKAFAPPTAIAHDYAKTFLRKFQAFVTFYPLYTHHPGAR